MNPCGYYHMDFFFEYPIRLRWGEQKMTPLKKARILAGKRQIDVYNEVGIWPARLSQLENGLVAPRRHEIEALSSVYGTSPEQIYNCKRWHGHNCQKVTR